MCLSSMHIRVKTTRRRCRRDADDRIMHSKKHFLALCNSHVLAGMDTRLAKADEKMMHVWMYGAYSIIHCATRIMQAHGIFLYRNKLQYCQSAAAAEASSESLPADKLPPATVHLSSKHLLQAADALHRSRQKVGLKIRSQLLLLKNIC